MQEDKKYEVVRKSNNLIETSQKLSLNEKRIIIMVVSQISKNDKNFKTTYKLKVKDINNFLDFKTKNYYERIRPVVRKLRGREIIIKKPGGGELVTGWASSAEYIPRKGEIEITIDPKLEPYLLQLSQAYTQYQIKHILKLKSINSMRIYELMKQYQKIGERTFEIATIKKYLGIGENKYKKFSNFKQKVLIPSMNEISNKTDIKFKKDKKGNPDIIKIKKGNKVTGIKLKLENDIESGKKSEYNKLSKNIPEKEKENTKLIINKIYNKKGADCLRWIIDKTNKRKTSEDSNYAGYMHSLLKLKLWEKEKEKIQKENEKIKEKEKIAKTKAEKEIDEMGKIIKERKEKDELIKTLTTEEDKELTKLAQSKLSGNLKTKEKLILNMKRSLVEEFVKGENENIS